MARPFDYASPGRLTDLGQFAAFPATLPALPLDICALVADLVIEPDDAIAAGVSEQRTGERNLRFASSIVSRLVHMRPEPLTVARAPGERVVGTCRHFALLACALLRHQTIASRVRCGFATYFQTGSAVDHWIVEMRTDERWVRVDPEVLGQAVTDRADDLRDEDFLSGAEAWLAHRAGQIDPDRFGVHGTENWGVGEIRGNLVKDLAALNKLEMLPWDEWGQMPAGYENTAGPAYDALLDRIAQACARDNADELAKVGTITELRVPQSLLADAS